ncbi:MFS transporter [Streptomyces sp. bgisy031]|uniref:MFS transporter n=1 Tax=Streptomyces sp. bgisy031 TaxID=3413772 RepID=UPI003D741980
MSHETVTPAGPPPPAQKAKSPRRAAASGWIGSALEYYDFFIYAQAAALVFPGIFFPSEDPQAAIIASLALFGVGYMARPLGAFVLGHWGDTHGRKNVLVLCMLMMGASTFLVGLLPTYSQIGLAAPIALVVLRLIQGFAVGGELSGASAMIVEQAPFGRRAFYACFSLQGVQAGQILAAAVMLPLSAFLPSAAFHSWGWRIPFLLSALVVVIGYVIRRRVAETAEFEKEKARQTTPKAPVLEAVRQSWPDMLRVAAMSLMNVVPTATNVFGATYATNSAYGNGFSSTTYLWISMVGNTVGMIVVPYVGNWADRIGRRPMIIIGTVSSGSLSYLYLYCISRGSLIGTFLTAMVMWGVMYQFYNAVFPSFFQELFPTRTRVTAFAVSQNIGTAVTAALPSVYSAVAGPGTNVPLIVGSFTFGCAVIATAAAVSARETYRCRLEDLGSKNARTVPRDEYRSIRATVGGRKAA